MNPRLMLFDRTPILALFLCLLAGSGSTAESQESYFPVEVGLRSTYHAQSASVSLVSEFTTEETLVDGTVATRRENTVTGSTSDQYWNYWSRNEGRTYLHGFWRPSESFGVVYDPPLVWLEAGISVGSSWNSAADVLDFETGEDVGTGPLSATLQGDVASTETVVVPAGEFETLRIHYTEPTPAKILGSRSYGVLGQRIPPVKDVAETTIEWRALGPGLIIAASPGEAEEEWFQLVDGPVGVEGATWSEVKTRYRP